MSSRRLLNCPHCGADTTVTSSQAGGTVVCECGQALEVPTLRRLQELPAAVEQATGSTGWGPRQGAVTLGLILTLIALSGAAWYAWREPAPPKPFDAEARRIQVETNLENLTPRDAWGLWVNFYEPQCRVGFSVQTSAQSVQTKALIEYCRLYRNSFLGLAAFFAAITAMAFFIIPQSQTGT